MKRFFSYSSVLWFSLGVLGVLLWGKVQGNKQGQGESKQEQNETSPAVVASPPSTVSDVQEPEVQAQGGALQEEFLAVRTQEYATPEERMQAVRAWMKEHGEELRAEREQERAKLQPLRDAQRQEAMEARKKQIAERLEAGKLGPKMAEMMMLATEEYDSPQQRSEAMRAWHEAHGEEWKAEQEARRKELQPLRDAQAAEERAGREAHIQEMRDSGKIGPLQAEQMLLSTKAYDSPQQRGEAVRHWMQANGAALREELAARKAQ